MGNAQWTLEVALLLLLAATLFHALRLERALGVLKRDRAVLEELVEGFNESTRLAESGIERLRLAADGAGRQMGRQVESAQKLRDDLSFLTDRSDRLAERLEMAVRSARMFADTAALPQGVQAASTVTGGPAQPAPLQQTHLSPDIRSDVVTPSVAAAARSIGQRMPECLPGDAIEEAGPRLRSQAERDLLRVLRAGR